MLLKVEGGIGQVYLDYLKMMNYRGHQVAAICHSNTIWAKKTNEIIDNKDFASEVSSKGGISAFFTILTIRKVCKKFRPDIIIIHNYENLCLWATKSLGIPRVGVAHMYKFKHVNKFNGYIALTQEIHDLITANRIRKCKIATIPNSIEVIAGKKPIFSSDDTPLIGGLGRLAHEKGFHVLIKALGELKRRDFKFKCIIGGDGPCENELFSLIDSEGLNQEIELLGVVSDKDSFYDRITIFALPSLSETFGLTILEAFKYCRPIVASNIGGPKEILTDNINALLFEPGNYKELADKIEFLCKNKRTAKRLVEDGWQVVNQLYCYDAVGGKLDDFMKSLTSPY